MNSNTDPSPGGLEYELKLMNTESATGFFGCVPKEELSFDQILEKAKAAPMDDFMHKRLLSRLGSLDTEELAELFEKAASENDGKLLAAIYETALTVERHGELKPRFAGMDLKELSALSPLVYIKWEKSENRELNGKWMELFNKNITRHEALPAPADTGLAPLFEKADLGARFGAKTDIEAICQKYRKETDYKPVPLMDTTVMALRKLNALGVFHEGEMRHEASLSPYALIRKWKMNLSVATGRNRYTLSGIQNSYGKGLRVEAARASNLMEVAERVSSFASVTDERVTGYKTPHPLTRASFGELVKSGAKALDPNLMALEVPYEDETVYWIKGENAAEEAVLVPVQAIFLFCNLDEPGLFSGLGSTGLASGNTMAEAKVSALLEVIERDCEGTTPFHPSQLFRTVTRIPGVASLFGAYNECGTHIQFQDLTSHLGVPCCKCFVIDEDGKIQKGTGAHLSAERALVSAMTETTHPFPNGPETDAVPEDLLTVLLEELPDYRTGTPEGDLALLEEILTQNGHHPVYVDLTREDLDIPVVKAIVPGLELTADFDEFSRVSPRLFHNYLTLYGE